jgi:2-oxoacid:acceptor oxidoreductase delta subunit (pyruvate/2-ketoisovalerate family)
MALLTAKELPVGGVIVEAGNSMEYKTGGWRTYRPVLSLERCVHCLQCWIFCPDSSIVVRAGKIVGFDLDHCKGCGICSKECPVKAIGMRFEGEMKDAEKNSHDR